METGALVFGPYTAIRAIGRGGMGVVYEARHPARRQRLALKAIHQPADDEGGVVARFLREVRALEQVRHDHVVRLVDSGIADGRPFIVMDFLEGESLTDLLARQGRLDGARIAELFLPVLSAMAAIHRRGIVHRDLKPANVMLARRPGGEVDPVLLDFGISRLAAESAEEAELTRSEALLGTLHYLSPEQLRCAKRASTRSDQYALGVMLYEAATGRRPFCGNSRYALMDAIVRAAVVPPSAWAPDLPPGFDEVVLRAMSRSPDDRFVSVGALASALLPFAGKPVWQRWASEFAGVDPEPTSPERRKVFSTTVLPGAAPPGITLGDEDTLRDSGIRGRGQGLEPRWYLFVALEADRPLSGGARYALGGVEEVVIVRGTDRDAVPSGDDGVRRLVLRLPGRALSAVHARMVRTPMGWTVEDARSTNGCFVNGARIEHALLGPDDLVEVGHSFLMVRALPVPPQQPPPDQDSRRLEGGPSGFSTLVPALASRLDELRRIARADVTLVLCGEAGTGKETLAGGVHALSGRRGPLVAVNCPALGSGFAEALHGRVRGAFSSAVAGAAGYLRAADGGTLLLDDVSGLDGAGQAALLRVLEDRQVVPVGAARARAVDVRFIATTPRPLAELVSAGRFRADLAARLDGFTHRTAPLRQRREDTGLLVAALLAKQGVAAASLPPEVALQLFRHDWPLNLRELEQGLRRAAAIPEAEFAGR